MGKIRRTRQKLHQTSLKSYKDNSPINDVVEEKLFEKEPIGKSPLLKTPEEFAAIPDNLFEGIDINFESLKKKLDEDDRLSVKSIAKSCKYDSNGKLLTKKEKMKIKHELFMRKINSVQQLKKEALQKHKKRKGIVQNSLVNSSHLHPNAFIEQAPPISKINNNTNEPADDIQIDTFSKKVKTTKIKPIKKVKARQREMLQEISAFRKLLTNPKFVKNPTAAITECVQERIIKETKNK